MKVKQVMAVVYLSLVLLLVACSGGGDQPDPSSEAQITGVVHFPDLSTGYQQKTVVYLDQIKSVITGPNGTFSFTEVPLGTHTLRIKSNLYGSQLYQIDLTADGASVDLDAYLTQVQTVVAGNGQVQLQMEPAFPAGASQLQVELSEEVTGGYQELGVVGPGTFSYDISNATQPGPTYYLKLTYLDQEDQLMRQIYSSFSYQRPIELSAPDAGEQVTLGTFFNWNQLTDATYRLKIASLSGSYQHTTGELTDSGYVLSDEFSLIDQMSYQWQVIGLVIDPLTGWQVSEVQSLQRDFVYEDGSQRAELSGTVHFPVLGTGTVAVVYLDETESVVTNSDGTFSFTQVPVGTHTLRVDSAQYGSDYVEVDLTTNGADVEIEAIYTSVLTLVQPGLVRVMVSPGFPDNVYAIKVGFGDTLTGVYQEWHTIAQGDLYVADVTAETQPDQKYYFKFTYLDQQGNQLMVAYNCFYYYLPLTIYEPGDHTQVNDQTQFSWSEIPEGIYQVRITSSDYSYSNVSSYLTNSEMFLGDEFDLTSQEYQWEVTGLVLDGTDNYNSDVRLKVRSKSQTVTY